MDESDADETPEVKIDAVRVDDVFGNTWVDAQTEPTDVTAPVITLLQMSTPNPLSDLSHVIVGENELVQLIITTDETLQIFPIVEATFVPECVADITGCDGPLLITPDVLIDEIGRNRWRVLIDVSNSFNFSNNSSGSGPNGYYNVYIQAVDLNDNWGTLGEIANIILWDFFLPDGQIKEADTIFFEADSSLPKPKVIPGDGDVVSYKDPFVITLDFTKPFNLSSADPEEYLAEIEEYLGDSFDSVVITRLELDGDDVTDSVSLVRTGVFEIIVEGIDPGEHEIKVDALDRAGNSLTIPMEVEFEVMAPEDTPTPTTVPPTQTPTLTPTPVPPTQTPTFTPTPVPPTLTPTLTSTPVPSTPTPTLTPTPVPPTLTPALTPTSVPPTLTPTLTPTPVPPTQTPTLTPTSVPPTRSPTFTVTPVPPAISTPPEDSGLFNAQLVVAALVGAAAVMGTGLLGYLALRVFRSRR